MRDATALSSFQGVVAAIGSHLSAERSNRWPSPLFHAKRRQAA